MDKIDIAVITFAVAIGAGIVFALVTGVYHEGRKDVLRATCIEKGGVPVYISNNNHTPFCFRGDLFIGRPTE